MNESRGPTETHRGWPATGGNSTGPTSIDPCEHRPYHSFGWVDVATGRASGYVALDINNAFCTGGQGYAHARFAADVDTTTGRMVMRLENNETFGWSTCTHP